MSILQSKIIAALVRGAGVALVVQVVGVALNYGLQIGLARWLGVAQYGAYDYAIVLATVLSFIAGLGLSMAVLRFIPEYQVKQDWSHLHGILRGSWLQTIAAGVLTAAVGTGIVEWFNLSDRVAYPEAIVLGIWTTPIIALAKLQQEQCRATRRIGLAYAPLLALHPVLLLIGAYFWQQNGSLTSSMALVLSGGLLLLVLLGQRIVFHGSLAIDIKTATPAYDLRRWLTVALPILLADGSFMLLNQTDTLMLGVMQGTASVGIYSAAFKTAAWVNFILMSVNAIAAPLFASLYAAGNRDGLQHLVSTIARWMFYPAAIVAVGLIGFADPVLSLFGEAFTAAKWAMMALIVGQLVNVGAGSVGYLLMMTGHQNQFAWVMGWSAVVNIVLNWVGIPLLGVLGAALATAISMSLWNVWLLRLVVKYLGVNPAIWAAWRTAPNR